jgi:adenylate cyclase
MRVSIWSSRLSRFLLGAVVVLGLSGERLWQAQTGHATLLDQLDNFIYDSRLRLSAVDDVPTFDPNVVIVDIDEVSLAKMGRWPWSRTQVAQLIEKIGEAKPAVIGTDIVFAESQSDDAQLSAALKKVPTVLGYYFSNDNATGTVGKLPEPSFSSLDVKGATRWKGFAANAVEFAGNSAGFFNPIIDSDGKVRRLPLVAEYQGQIYDSFAVAVLRKYFSNSPLSIQNDRFAWASSTKFFSIPFSQSLTALIPFESRSGVSAEPSKGRFRYVSAAHVLDQSIPKEAFSNKVVLVGTSAIGIADLRATPVNQVLPGVESHATLISGVLNRHVNQEPANAQEMAAIALLVGGLVLAGLLAMAGPSGVLIIGTLAVLGTLAMFSATFSYLGWWLPSASAYVLLLSLFALNLLLGYWGEGRVRRAMQSLFGEYVPPHLVDQMSREPQRFSGMLSENKELTVLFADVRGFTRIAETMQPTQLREFINEYLTAMTDVIHRHGGTVDKYIGDAIMAFWGAPLADDLHADNAVAAALQMLQEAERLSVTFELRGLPPLAIGIGINTGVVCVGDMGSKSRRAYTVLGDAVNLAARFEAMTKNFTVPLVLGTATVAKLTRSIVVSLGSVAVQGRNEPVEIFTVAEFSNLVTNTIPLPVEHETQSTRL